MKRTSWAFSCRRRPRGLTLASGQRNVERGFELVEPAHREALVERIREAPVEQRNAFVEGLRELSASRSELVNDLEDG